MNSQTNDFILKNCSTLPAVGLGTFSRGWWEWQGQDHRGSCDLSWLSSYRWCHGVWQWKGYWRYRQRVWYSERSVICHHPPNCRSAEVKKERHLADSWWSSIVAWAKRRRACVRLESESFAVGIWYAMKIKKINHSAAHIDIVDLYLMHCP